ncbi:expressed unknown protein [Seminavis robusta]|uniref:MYND-type domain-containing protein n=1 Tax=Seminavis robusta TaxID=568900 RepID=A0A9N8EG49_9STRA|nr:expressed unknown protein [Seminavis robusta]|eukprot:Sro1108_g242160.1 n/a (319) ;mRNA; r:9755-10711
MSQGDKPPAALAHASRVLKIVRGEGGPRPVCSQCRIQESDIIVEGKKMLRCSRCKVAHYCGGVCQKKHFPFHKHSCRDIAEQLVEPGSSCIALGESLVKMGYRETDTIDNGAVYYRAALSSFLDVFRGEKQDTSNNNQTLEVKDKVLALLVILGGDTETMLEWLGCIHSNGKSGHDNQSTSKGKEQPKHDFAAEDDATFQILSLLVNMRHVARREQQQSTEPEQTAMEHTTEKERIQETISILKRQGNIQYLIHLRDSIPFGPLHAPDLFQQQQQTNKEPCPPEFWMLLQDCFFLTPGLNSVLHEFVSEEEYPAITVD